MEQINNIEIESFSSLFYTGSWTIIDILILLIALDILSGVIKAMRNHTLKSSIANLGLAKRFRFYCNHCCEYCRFIFQGRRCDCKWNSLILFIW